MSERPQHHLPGIELARIALMLPCMRDCDGGPSEIATPPLVEDLKKERQRIDRMIAGPHATRDVLDDVIDAASG